MTITKLTAEDSGVYMVETQGSFHLWNLDEGWYIRNPSRIPTDQQIVSEALRGFDPEFSGTRQPLGSVERYPEVGNTFFVRLPPPQNWHQSSLIKSITKIEEES